MAKFALNQSNHGGQDRILKGINRIAPWGLFVVMVWLAWRLAQLFWLFLAPPVVPSLSPESPQITTPQAFDSHAFAIFATPNPTPAPTNLPPPNVQLKGVMPAKPDRYSSAVLEVNGVIKNYRLNETLTDTDYRLVAVSWNEVVIASSKDQQSVIRLRDPLSLNQGLKNDQNRQQISNATLPAHTHNNNPLPNAQTPPTSSQQGQASESDPISNAFSHAITELQQNPANYLSQMGVMATGDAYEVSDVMPEEIRQQLGLEVGDRVLSVNGQGVGSDFAKDADLLRQIQQSGDVSVQVQRGDQVITIRQQF